MKTRVKTPVKAAMTPQPTQPSAPDEEAAFLKAQERRIVEGRHRAVAITRGTYQAGHVAEVFARRVFAETPLGDMAVAIGLAGDAVAAGDLSGVERMLSGQIIALHAVFTDCAMRAQANMGTYAEPVERYMRIALKAQAQCARTAEVLGNLRAGPTIFAKQANVTTGPQQVNNHGQPSTHAPAQESAKSGNELLRDGRHEQITLDTGAPCQGLAGHSPLGAVAAIHGAADGGGQGHRGSE